MTGFPPLDITVIYADDRRSAGKARSAAAVPRTRSTSRVLGVTMLAASAAWLALVWFPVDSYLYMCLMLKAPAVPANVDIGQLLFGGPPPVELAISSSPSDKTAESSPDSEEGQERDISAYRATGTPPAAKQPDYESAGGRQFWPYVVNSWLAIITVAGLSLALVGGGGLVQWAGAPSAARPALLLALFAAIAIVFLAYTHWPKGGDVPTMGDLVQWAFAAAFAVLAGTLCGSLPPPRAAQIFIAVMLALGVVGWILWSRYGIGFPKVAQRAAVLLLMVPAGLLGAALAGRLRGLTAVAMGAVIVAALATSIGMAYGHRVGGFVDPVPGWPEYGKIMALHGVALLPLLWARYASR